MFIDNKEKIQMNALVNRRKIQLCFACNIPLNEP